jgi:hypothetical protein
MSKTLLFLYASVTSDLTGIYRHWLEGQDSGTQRSIIASSLFSLVYSVLNAETYVLFLSER